MQCASGLRSDDENDHVERSVRPEDGCPLQAVNQLHAAKCAPLSQRIVGI